MPRFFLILLVFSFFIISCGSNKSSSSEKVDVSEDDAEKIAHLKIGNAEDYNQALDILNMEDLETVNVAIKIFHNTK